jgi:hypothetical protein
MDLRSMHKKRDIFSVAANEFYTSHTYQLSNIPVRNEK